MVDLTQTSWTLANATLQLGALAAAVSFGSVVPLALATCASFALLVATSRGAWTPGGGFGVANALTAGRFLALLAALVTTDNGWAIGAMIGVFAALDGVDGWLARKRGEASAFGAHFDMEIDAASVLLMSATIVTQGRLGGWALLAGALRPLYVVARACVPARRAAPERRAQGMRTVYVLLIAGYVTVFTAEAPVATVAFAAATALLVWSFSADFALLAREVRKPA